MISRYERVSFTGLKGKEFDIAIKELGISLSTNLTERCLTLKIWDLIGYLIFKVYIQFAETASWYLYCKSVSDDVLCSFGKDSHVKKLK